MNKSITFIITLVFALVMTLSQSAYVAPSAQAKDNNTSTNTNNNQKEESLQGQQNTPSETQPPPQTTTGPETTTNNRITPNPNPPTTTTTTTPSEPSTTTITPPLTPSAPPSTTTTTTGHGGPDQDCLFHPELAKCKSDNGKCPAGFNQNEDGNCFPKHDRCPKGYHSHEDDETGRCIPDNVPCQAGYIRDPSFPTCSSKSFLCKDHPELRGCKEGDKRPSNENNHNRDIIIIKNIIHHKHTGSGGSSSISKDCYDAFRIVWLGNIHKGENKEIDTFMDKCFGLV